MAGKPCDRGAQYTTKRVRRSNLLYRSPFYNTDVHDGESLSRVEQCESAGTNLKYLSWDQVMLTDCLQHGVTLQKFGTQSGLPSMSVNKSCEII